MTCPVCGGILQVGEAPEHITRKAYHLILDRVPALVCTQCGDAYFDSKVVAMIDQAINALDELDEKLAAFAPELETIASELVKPAPKSAEIIAS